MNGPRTAVEENRRTSREGAYLSTSVFDVDGFSDEGLDEFRFARASGTGNKQIISALKHSERVLLFGG